MDEQNKSGHDLDSTDGLADFFSDVDEDDQIDGDYDEIDQIIDEVMALLENVGPITGGIITFSAIYKYLQQGNHPDLTKDLCFDVIARMRTNQVITDEISYPDIPDFHIYIFQDLHFTDEMKQLIKVFASATSHDLQSLIDKTSWEESRLNSTLQIMIEQKIITLENGNYSVRAFSL